MALNVAIVVPWVMLALPGPHAGLALATGLSALLNATLLFRGLHRDGVYRPSAGWGLFTGRIAVAAAVMSLALWFATPALAAWGEWAAPDRVVRLVGLIALGAGSYAATLLLLGVRPRQFLMR
jgi:putative peptidoglycan lipid II flippase